MTDIYRSFSIKIKLKLIINRFNELFKNKHEAIVGRIKALDGRLNISVIYWLHVNGKTVKAFKIVNRSLFFN